MNEDSGTKYSTLKSLSDLLRKIIPISENESGVAENARRSFIDLTQQCRKNKVFSEDTSLMMEALLEFGQTHVRDIMIPRGQIISIHNKMSSDEILKVILESGHSRYPVFNGDKDEVIGILLTKDVLPLLAKNCNEHKDFISVIRPVTIVPESKTLDSMLRDFRSKRNHMAVVIDEYGNISGLVTIEDVLEEIVGEIDDEHDKVPDLEIRKITDDVFEVQGVIPIEHFNSFFKTNISDEDADTIAGYLLQQFGEMPKVGYSLTVETDEDDLLWQLIVSKANQRRLISIRIQRLSKQAENE